MQLSMPNGTDDVCVQAARHRAEHIPYIVMRGFGISSIAYFLDAIVAGALVWMAAVSFKQAASSSPEQQLPHVFQGIIQIGVMFTQVTTITVCLAVVQSLEAAVRWPDIVIVTAVACAMLAGVRTAAMGLVMLKYTPGSGKGAMALMGMRKGGTQDMPWIDRAAITIVGGLLLPFSMPASNPVSSVPQNIQPTMACLRNIHCMAWCLMRQSYWRSYSAPDALPKRTKDKYSTCMF